MCVKTNYFQQQLFMKLTQSVINQSNLCMYLQDRDKHYIFVIESKILYDIQMTLNELTFMRLI